MKASNFLFLNIFILILSGCTGVGQPDQDSELQFSIRGKLGVRTQGEGYSANIRWLQYPDRYQISLWGPLGQGRTEIVGSGQWLSITDAKGDLIEGGDTQAIMQARLGWAVPLEVLQYWVQGLVAEDYPVEEAELNKYDQLIALQQLGWHIGFTWRGETAEKFPYKLVAERATTKLTLLIKDSLAKP